MATQSGPKYPEDITAYYCAVYSFVYLFVITCSLSNVILATDRRAPWLTSASLAIKETLGSGGYAKVKLAKHKVTGEKVRLCAHHDYVYMSTASASCMG
jgi:hypothetical protein